MNKIKRTAKKLARKGRRGDKHLLHITDKELLQLASTGRLTVNPKTGLPEASWLSSTLGHPSFDSFLDPGGQGSTLVDPGGIFGQGSFLHGPQAGFIGSMNTDVPGFASDVMKTPIGAALIAAFTGGYFGSGSGTGAAASDGSAGSFGSADAAMPATTDASTWGSGAADASGAGLNMSGASGQTGLTVTDTASVPSMGGAAGLVAPAGTSFAGGATDAAVGAGGIAAGFNPSFTSGLDTSALAGGDIASAGISGPTSGAIDQVGSDWSAGDSGAMNPGLASDSSSSWWDWLKQNSTLKNISNLAQIGGGGYGIYNAVAQRRAQKAAQDQKNNYANQLQALQANPQSLTTMPGYQFGLDQGTQAVQRKMAAMGYGTSGNLATALQRYGSDYSTNFLQQQEQNLAQLYGMASPGAQPMTDPTALALRSLSYGGYGAGNF